MTTSPDRVVGDPFAGTTLDARYRLDTLIGRGGMASVYRGEDLALGRQVAVKVFAEAAEGIDDTDRRRSETALLASLAHRALVRLYDASRDPETGREYLVMELVDGRDLRETLKLGPLTPADAAGMVADLAEALHVIHERGIVHRDIKPANVLLEPAHLPSRTWNAKLADFGIARLIDDARLTRTGLLVGTPGYLSPEQVSGAAPSPAADIYSLGLVLLEALTAVRAFPGSPTEAALARLHRAPDIPTQFSPGWRDLLMNMLALDPAARPSTGAIAQRLSKVVDPGSTTPATVTPGERGETTTRVLPATASPPATTAAEASQPSAIDQVGDAISHRAVDGWRRVRGMPEHHRAVAIAVLLLVVLLVVAAIAANQPESPGDVPAETPRELRQPLRDLHDAVNGR